MDQALASLSKLSQQPLYLMVRTVRTWYVRTLPYGGSTTHGRYFCNIWCIFRHFPAARTRSASSPEPPKPHSEATQLSAGFQETNSPNTKHPHTAYAFTYAFLLLSQHCSKIKAQFHIQKYPLQLLSLIPMSCCFDACICVHVLI